MPSGRPPPSYRKAMLDADTRLAAARRMFDARHEQPMRAAASSAKTDHRHGRRW